MGDWDFDFFYLFAFASFNQSITHLTIGHINDFADANFAMFKLSSDLLPSTLHRFLFKKKKKEKRYNPIKIFLGKAVICDERQIKAKQLKCFAVKRLYLCGVTDNKQKNKMHNDSSNGKSTEIKSYGTKCLSK